VFHSGYDNWPVNIDGVALVNTAFVWLPVALAAIFPNTLRWLGLARVGLTLVNGIILDRGDQADMCKHDRVLFLPFTILMPVLGIECGTLTGGNVGLIVLYGVLLHPPATALFGIPFLLQRRRHLASS
jgi:hypothetical protein